MSVPPQRITLTETNGPKGALYSSGIRILRPVQLERSRKPQPYGHEAAGKQSQYTSFTYSFPSHAAALQDFKLDSPLAQYQPQYLITMNLWMAFHSHSNRDHDAISSFAYKARDILIAAIAPELANTPVKGAVMKQAPKPKATKDTKPSTRIANSTVRKTGVPRPKKGEALPRSRTASNIPNMCECHNRPVCGALIMFSDSGWLEYRGGCTTREQL